MVQDLSRSYYKDIVSYSLSFLFPQILRLEIDGSGDPYCVGQWTSNPVGHIEVDPVHG